MKLFFVHFSSSYCYVVSSFRVFLSTALTHQSIFWVQHRVVCYVLTAVSEGFTASIALVEKIKHRVLPFVFFT